MDTTPLSIAIAGLKLEIETSTVRFTGALDKVARDFNKRGLLKSGPHIRRMLEVLEQEGSDILEKIIAHAEIALYPSIASSEQERFIAEAIELLSSHRRRREAEVVTRIENIGLSDSLPQTRSEMESGHKSEIQRVKISLHSLQHRLVNEVRGLTFNSSVGVVQTGNASLASVDRGGSDISGIVDWNLFDRGLQIYRATRDLVKKALSKGFQFTWDDAREEDQKFREAEELCELLFPTELGAYIASLWNGLNELAYRNKMYRDEHSEDAERREHLKEAHAKIRWLLDESRSMRQHFKPHLLKNS